MPIVSKIVGDKSMSDKWEPCPRCGSNKTRVRAGREVYVCFLVIFIFGILLGKSGLLVGIIPGLIIGAIVHEFWPSKRIGMMCKDCEHKWDYRNIRL